jgi:hypothetical protein
MPGESRIFEPEEDFGAEGRSGNGGRNHRPAEGRRDGISEATAKQKIGGRGDAVRESLEEDVRVNAVSPKVQVDGKIHAGNME